MNSYLKNVLFAGVGILVIIGCYIIPQIPASVAGYVVFFALLFVAKGVGKIINLFAMDIYKKKNPQDDVSVRDNIVINKSKTVTTVIVLTALVAVLMRPDLFGTPTTPVTLFIAILAWYIINIPVFLYQKKHLVVPMNKL